MLTYGTQVNPALLRQDFSSILQGAQAQAQGITQAAQTRAQMMANIGSQVSEGFKTYVQNREKNSILEGKNSGMLRSMGNDPALNADPEFLKLKQKQEKSGGLSLGDNAKMNALLTTYSEQNRMRQEEQRQKDYLKLAQDAAAINTERAAREKAEYTRRNQFQENIIRLAKEKPEVLQDPKMVVAAVIDAGGNFEDAQRIQGSALTQQQFELEKTQRQMDFQKRSLELAEAARRGEVSGKEPGVKVVEQNGVKLAYLLDALNQPIGQPHVVAQGKPTVGEKTQRNALEYHIAETRGDTAGMQRAMIDIIADNPEATRNLSPQEIRQNFILPFVPRVGGEVAPTEPLKVTGAPKPISAPPAPSPEAARITQSPNPTPPGAPQPTATSAPSGPVPVIQIPAQSIESSSIPFAPAAMDSTFLDREAQATDRGAYRPFDAAMAERYQTPAQGAIPQIKLSPAAQKIANELRRSAESGERGKTPQFFLEASTGDNGKRTRVKLGRNELFAILTNNPMPNLSPTLEVDREETRRLMDQQMRMNELMRQYRPPARRAR